MINHTVNNREIDIIAKKKITDHIITEYLIELKVYSRPINVPLIQQVYSRCQNLKRYFNSAIPVIISTTPLTNSAKETAKELGVEFWGMSQLKELVSQEIFDSIYSDFLDETIDNKIISDEKVIKGKTKEEVLIENLVSIPTGKKDWSLYQETIYEIVEHLFSPPLESPKYENADRDLRNRRDIIMENASQNGYWKSIKEDYGGYYIVVDAKNYSKPITKRPIVDVAHYLKPYGCGMFGIIFSRKGIGNAGIHARKEQWVGNNKMIVVLSDEDVIKMLNEKKEDGFPEEIIREKIAKFRMEL